MKTKRNRSAGFTLIEMLVVVAIILLLLAILTPALGRALSTAELAECSAQQAQMGKTNADLLADRFNNFSDLGTFLRRHDDGTATDPADDNPLMMAADKLETRNDVGLSYGINDEYRVFGSSLAMVRPADSKVMFYDGISGAGTDAQGNANASNSHDHKVTITHDPSARGENGGVQTPTVAGSALAAHIGHGDPIGDGTGTAAELALYNMGEFDPRHPFGNGLGNVLYVDGHVEAHPFMTADMFLAQQPAGPGNSGNNGNGNNGNGNGNGNGNN